MNTILIGALAGVSAILASYLIARIIGAAVARADRREQIDQRLSEFAGDWPILPEVFPPHCDGGDTR